MNIPSVSTGAFFSATTGELIGSASAAKSGFSLFGGDGLGFKDFLDVINPLQQLPIVGTLYRAITGDTISTAAKLAGGGLFGGPLGFGMALLDTGVEGVTGDDIGGNVLSLADSAISSTQASQAYAKAGAL